MSKPHRHVSSRLNCPLVASDPWIDPSVVPTEGLNTKYPLLNRRRYSTFRSPPDRVVTVGTNVMSDCPSITQ